MSRRGLVTASESAIQAATFDFRRQVDPDFGIGEAAAEVGVAATGTFLFAGTVKGLAQAYNAARARGRTQELSQQARDAGNVVMRAAANGETPHTKTSGNQTTHNVAINQAAEDLEAGRPVALPEDAFIAQSERPGRVYDSDGRSVPVKYEVVEAADLITSHNRDFAVNPEFPAELQPRQRERPISQEQIVNISNRLQPERLGPSVQSDSGAPIIGGDNIVESGNARVLALKRVYEDNGVNANNYRTFLRSQGYDIDDFAEPVLVARRLGAMDIEERVRFTTAANRSTAMRLGITEQAFADARLIDGPLLDTLRGTGVGTLRNRSFVRGFMSKLSRSEQGGLVGSRGVLSQEGERRLTGALMARAFDDVGLLNRTLEDADTNIRAIGGALADVAPVWARLRDTVVRGEVPAGMDITKHLIDAVGSVMRARDTGRPLAEFLEQGEMFGGPGEIAQLIGRFLFRDADLKRPVSRKAIAEMLTAYAERARQNVTGPRLLGEALEDREILEGVMRGIGRSDLTDRYKGTTETLKRTRVVSSVRLDEAAAPERAVELAASREVEDEILRELDGLRSEQDVRVLITEEDEAGGQIFVERSLDDLVDEADAEIDAARQIEACLTSGQEG